MFDKNRIPAGTKQELFDGYVATKLQEPDGPSYGYEVVGPRKTWRLMRNMRNPRMLFVIGENRAQNWNIRGYKWFCEQENGTLRPSR